MSYLVLCVRLGYKLPGTSTIPEQISRDKRPYYTALETADKAAAQGQIDVSKMEELIESLLANQLLSIMAAAKSGDGAPAAGRAS